MDCGVARQRQSRAAAVRQRRPRPRESPTPLPFSLGTIAVWGGLLWTTTKTTRATDVPTGSLTVQSICNRQIVKVTRVVLTCDSPSSYERDSKTYQNSTVCRTGDQANLWIQFVVTDTFQGEAVLISVSSGLYDRYNAVVSSADVCSLGTVTSLANATNSTATCPQPGYYQLQTYYTVPQTRDYTFLFTPDVQFFFDDDQGRRLGCVTTGTMALHQRADSKAQQGLVALGVSIVVFLLLFGVLLYFSYRRKKRIQHLAEQKTLQRYQYFRTLPNGQVVPMQGGLCAGPSSGPSASVSLPPPTPLSTFHSHPNATLCRGNPLTPVPSSDVSAHGISSRTALALEALNISNPSYNEPQIPTRPLL
jgi:hypothetical protein